MPKAHVFGMDSLGGDERFEVERVRGPSGKLYVSTGAFQLRPGSEPRRSAIRLVESSLFDPLILLTILANCATMAWQSPLDPCCTWKEAFIDKCEWVFLAWAEGSCITSLRRVLAWAEDSCIESSNGVFWLGPRAAV